MLLGVVMLYTTFALACLLSCSDEGRISCANGQGAKDQLNALAQLLLVFEPVAALRASSRLCRSHCMKVNNHFGNRILVMRMSEATLIKPDVKRSYFHIPVMLEEVISGLIIDGAGTYVDATVGGGGHAAAILEVLAPNGGHLVCVDRDPDALKAASQRLRPHIVAGTATLVQSNFAMLAEAMTLLPSSSLPRFTESKKIDGVLDGMLLDLGPSSYQLDEPSRGFSPQHEGPLDMRMDQEGIEKRTAWDIVNHQSTAFISDILSYHCFPSDAGLNVDAGAVHQGRLRMWHIAEQICSKRPISTTSHLRQVLEEAFSETDVNIAFEALRREVNQDFSAHEAVLNCAARLVRPGGRLAVISYGARQDLEVSRHMEYAGEWQVVTQPRCPSNEEVEANRRAREAVLRIFERTPNTASPVWAIKRRYMEGKPILAPIKQVRQEVIDRMDSARRSELLAIQQMKQEAYKSLFIGKSVEHRNIIRQWLKEGKGETYFGNPEDYE